MPALIGGGYLECFEKDPEVTSWLHGGKESFDPLAMPLRYGVRRMVRKNQSMSNICHPWLRVKKGIHVLEAGFTIC